MDVPVRLNVPVSAQAPSTPAPAASLSPARGDSSARRRALNPRATSCSVRRRARSVAIRAGRLFDSISGRMLTKQVVLITGERITEVGPEGQVRIPAGVQVIDLSQATVLPGLIDAHTHMYNTRRRA